MWVRMAGFVALGAILSGCTAARGRHDLSRLQSQVSLLDERVTQLERAGVSAFPAGSSGGGATDFGSPQGALIPPEPALARKVPASPAAASLKPTTREIQHALKNAGFYQGALDGKMGPQTRNAIKEFQRVHGLTDDGVVGKQTWAKLQAYADLSGGGELNAGETLK